MSAGPEGRAPGAAISSPELALVDPETRALGVEQAQAASIFIPPDDLLALRPAVAPETDVGPTEDPVADGDLTEAMRRLAELADVDPPERRSRSTRALGIAFAATAWLVLAVVVADLQLWRL